MALYDDFPYSNFHALNLDWIVRKLSELENGESSSEQSSTQTLAQNLSGNYPYTNFHALNLDWIIRSMVELESNFETLENEWENLSATGLLTDEVKNAILQCFENVAWVNDQGQQYYNALRDLFFPPVVVSTLTAVLDQGERVFHTGEDVNVIKDYLTVTAELTDGALITVPPTQYVLTGSLSQEGPNIIVVTYMNASTTITVNAVAVNLVSISAVYTQSGTVYTSDTLDSLKSDLVVTAHYSDSSTSTVPSADYTLSGTLTAGTSVITVTYQGMTTTFNVTVSVVVSLYPFVSGSHTFSDGSILTISNGNHVKYECKTSVSAVGPYNPLFNLSNIEQIVTTDVNNQDSINNKAKTFSLATGDVVKFSADNVVTDDSNYQIQLNMRTANGTTSIGPNYMLNVVSSSGNSVTVTSSAVDVSCAYAYFLKCNANKTYEFDMHLTVNDVVYY